MAHDEVRHRLREASASAAAKPGEPFRFSASELPEELQRLRAVLHVAQSRSLPAERSSAPRAAQPVASARPRQRPADKVDLLFQDFPFGSSLFRGSALGITLEHALTEFELSKELARDQVLECLEVFDAVVRRRLPQLRQELITAAPQHYVASGAIWSYKIYDNQYYLYVRNFKLSPLGADSASKGPRTRYFSRLARIKLIGSCSADSESQ